MRKAKVIVDTNRWISFLISDDMRLLQDRVFANEVELIFSEDLLDEIFQVLDRKKFRSRLKKEDLDNFRYFISRFGTVIPVTTAVDICRDPNDNFLLALAIDSGADYLITGDKDLLVLRSIQTTRILTYPEWRALYE